MTQVAIIAWSPRGASNKAGDLVFVDETDDLRARTRHTDTGHLGRILLDHLVMLPTGVEPDDPRVRDLLPPMRTLLAECEHLAEARELGHALINDVFGDT